MVNQKFVYYILTKKSLSKVVSSWVKFCSRYVGIILLGYFYIFCSFVYASLLQVKYLPSISFLKCLGLSTKSKVADFIKNDSQNSQQGRRCNSQVNEFQDDAPPPLLQHLHREDHVDWLGSPTGDFFVRSAMKKLFSSGLKME